MYGAKLYADEADIEYRRGAYNGVQGYARTKRMQVVMADAWATRLAGTDVRVESMHPGWVETPGVASHLPTFNKVTGPLLRDATDGADTAVWLVATRPPSTQPALLARPRPAADDVRLAAAARRGRRAALPRPRDRVHGHPLVALVRRAGTGLGDSPA